MNSIDDVFSLRSSVLKHLRKSLENNIDLWIKSEEYQCQKPGPRTGNSQLPAAAPVFPTTGLFPSPEDFGLLSLIVGNSEDDLAGIDHVELRTGDTLNVMAVLAELFLSPDLSELLGKSR